MSFQPAQLGLPGSIPNPGTNSSCVSYNGYQTQYVGYTTTQRLALSPVNGLVVYDSTLQGLYVYQNGGWQPIYAGVAPETKINSSYFYGSASSATFDFHTSHSPNGALITNIVQSVVGGQAATITYGSGSYTVAPGIYNLQANMITYMTANASTAVDIVFTVYDIGNSAILDSFIFYTQSATLLFYQNCSFSVVIPNTTTHFGIYVYNSSTNSYSAFIDLDSNVTITRLDL